MSSLFVIRGRDQGRRFLLDEDEIGLGRDVANRIQLQDTEVSRRHAAIYCDPNQVCSLVDLGSSNGTFVNNERIERHELTSGDRVQLGRTLMIYTGIEEMKAGLESVNIIDRDMADDESQIIRSMSQEESHLASPDQWPQESDWLTRARSNLQVMYRTALAVSHTMDIDQLLGRILELIFEWVEADRGCIMLIDQESQELTPRAYRHRSGENPQDTMRISQTILDYVKEHEEGVLTSDAKDDQRWDPAASIVKMGVREAVAVPMQGRYGIVGVIYIDTYTPPGRVIQEGSSKRFTDEHLKLMIAIGHQAALAVEDTSYYSAMVQAERLAAIGQTIAGLSHHIKNILQGIRGGSFLIEEGLNNSQQDIVRQGWKIVEKNQERISNLVLDMLTFSKEREPDLRAANLNDVVADVVELMQSRAGEMQIQLSWQPDASMPMLMFDPEGLHRSILNVLTNALDACQSQEDGNVRVRTEYDAGKKMARIVVEDNGHGIEEDELKKIFHVFESRKGSRGTGLGLSVSQKILKEHGGDIDVESTIGEGSRFVLWLPASRVENDVVRSTDTRFHDQHQHHEENEANNPDP